jgi:o-succinylbenzoate synthase
VKIQQINLYQLRMKLRTPFETSFGRIQDRECVVVELKTETETGWGECTADRAPGYSYETTGTAMHIMRDFLGPALLETGETSMENFWQGASLVRGHNLAKAGIEMALWDLLGKQEGIPLTGLLGGVRDKVEVGVSVGLQENPEGLVKTVAGYVEQGYRRIKIKIKPGRDAKDTRAVREAFPELRLQVDANSAYTLETAGALKDLDDLNLLLIEQPLAEDDLWDHRILQERLKTPLCLDESITSPRHARQALEMKACRVINIKSGRVGGLSHALQIHNHCYEHGIPVWCGGMLETGIGRAANLALAALPGFSLPGDISATERYYTEDITDQRFVLNADSTIDVPKELPGLGVEIDRRALERACITKLEILK